MAENPSPAGAPYEGPLAPGMVFDYEPGKKHKYERLTITQIKGSHIWARGRSGATFYEEPEFRSAVVFVSETPIKKDTVPVQTLKGRYDGPVEVGMVFDFEPGHKHRYERMTVTRMKDGALWAYGRSGETYHEVDEFRDSVAPVPKG